MSKKFSLDVETHSELHETWLCGGSVTSNVERLDPRRTDGAIGKPEGATPLRPWRVRVRTSGVSTSLSARDPPSENRARLFRSLVRDGDSTGLSGSNG